MTPALTAEGGKCYAGALESHHHLLLNYRRHRLWELVLFSEMDAAWLSTAKGLMTEVPYRALKRQDTMDSLVVLSFLLRAKEGIP